MKSIFNTIPFCATVFLIPFLSLAEITSQNQGATTGQTYIPIGQAKAKKTIISIAPPTLLPTANAPSSAGKLQAASKKVIEVFKNDLLFMDQYLFLDPSLFPKNPLQASYPDWQKTGSDILLQIKMFEEGANLATEAHLHDIYRGKELLSKKYIAAPGDTANLAHTLGNDVVRTLTGLPGIFLTKIAMSCDRTRKKEIYIMNFDGSEPKQVTHHQSISLGPAWSRDNAKVAYSVYTYHQNKIKNIDLYEFDFRSNQVKLLSNRKGINSGAHYHPRKNELALTMSFLGNPEIFSLNLDNLQANRLTSSFGVDVDPNWSPDGSKLAFVSSRSGQSMIYTMNADGSDVKRMTYAGQYNATPSWAPNGGKLVFAGWIDKRFDIFTMNSDGTQIERLTKNQGNNEDPDFSPDGGFVVFSSNRAGNKNIYIMNTDGTFSKRLTYGLGNCVSPRWSFAN